MKRILVLIGILVLLKGILMMLSGCGVEGPPRAPGTGGTTVTGEAAIGVRTEF